MKDYTPARNKKLNAFNTFHICRFKDYEIHGQGPILCSMHKQMEYLVAAILGTPFFHISCMKHEKIYRKISTTQYKR